MSRKKWSELDLCFILSRIRILRRRSVGWTRAGWIRGPWCTMPRSRLRSSPWTCGTSSSPGRWWDSPRCPSSYRTMISCARVTGLRFPASGQADRGIFRSVTFWSGSADPYHWLTDPSGCGFRIRIWILLFSSVADNMPTKIKYFEFFCLLLFEGTHLHQFSKIKSQKEVTI